MLTPDDLKVGSSRASGEILETLDNWTELRSGWVIDRSEIIHISFISYHPVGGGSYIPLPATILVNKSVINVKIMNITASSGPCCLLCSLQSKKHQNP